MKVYKNLFDQIISPENLFAAWDAFKSDKRNRPDVLRFEWHLEENIFRLHRDLRNGAYRHGSYASFYITDPKQRHIHKATVRDRVLHHAVFSIINPIFEPTFISSSFSCRIGYGTHRGVAKLEVAARKIQKNGTSQCFVLKCDIQKFFDSVDHAILLAIMSEKIKDENAMRLLKSIVESYSVPQSRERERERESKIWGGKGIPIGNLTSQIFANIYMNEFDQFVKHKLKIRYYFRYTDDFAAVAKSREFLGQLLPLISEFLDEKLALRLHPGKIIIRPLYHGIDFLGLIVFPKHRLVRTKTRRRMFKNLKRRIAEYNRGQMSKTALEQSLQSYLGVLSHADAYYLSQELRNEMWFN